ADLDLGADGIPVRLHERKEAVRGAAGDQLQLAGLEETPKAVDEVVAVLIDKNFAGAAEAIVVHPGQVIEFRLPAGALDSLPGERYQVVDVTNVEILQERIGQHGGQGRRNRHG